MQQPFPLVPEGDSSGLEVRSQSSSAAGVVCVWGMGGGRPQHCSVPPPDGAGLEVASLFPLGHFPPQPG